jgi:RHS repeat-associated protein
VCRYRYNGKELNEELGLYDYGARWYDPAVARFTGVDKLADDIMQVDKSPYAYAWNNPINLSDPDGNCPMCFGAVVGAVLDYGTQVAVNLASGDDLGTALTDVNKTSIVASAVAGAAGVGLIAKAGKLVNGKTLQAAEAVIDGTVNAAQQLATTGEVDIEQVAVGVLAGQVVRTPVKEKVKANRTPGQKQLDKTARRADRLAKNSEARNNPSGNASPTGRPGKTARLQSEAQNSQQAATKYARSTTTRAAASGVAASGGTVRIWNAATSQFQEVRQ